MDSISKCQIFSVLKQREANLEADDDSNVEREHAPTLHSPKLLLNLPTNKLTKFTLVATISILIMIAITFIISLNSEREDTDEAMRIPHGLILMSDDSKIWTVNPLDKSYRVLRQFDASLNTFDTYHTPTNGVSAVWIENSTSVNFNSKEYSHVEIPRKIKPQAVAVDPITGKLYIVDKFAETLNIIDLRHNHTGVVLSDLNAPHDILLDPSHGVMFILQLSHSIIRGNMDGSWTKVIVRNAKISAIALSCKSRRIYWAKNSGVIESSNYEGKNIKLWTQVSTDVVALAIFDNQLFYLSPNNDSNCSILHSCTIYGESCEKHSKRELRFHSEIMKATSDEFLDLFKNPCENENGGCEQMCLLNLNGRHSCACSIGWILNGDLISCHRASDFLLYSDENYFRGICVGSERDRFTDIILPVRFSIECLDNKQTIDFDISWLSDQIFFSDDKSIYSLHIHDGSQNKIFKIDGDFFMRDLAVDHSSKNLYYFKVSGSTNKHLIEVLTVKKGEIFRKTIFSSLEQFKPFNLLVSNNLLYFTKNFTGETIKSIIRTTLDGEKSRNISGSSNGLFTFMDGNLLYIEEITNNSIGMISEIYGNLYEWKFSMSNLNRILWYASQMYISNLTSVWRSCALRTASSSGFEKIIPRTEDVTRKISGIRVVNFHSINLNLNNECSINNGDCQQFCFALPERKCGCMDHSNLIDNNRCT